MCLNLSSELHKRIWPFLCSSRKWQSLCWGMKGTYSKLRWQCKSMHAATPKPLAGTANSSWCSSTWAQTASTFFQQSPLDAHYQMTVVSTGDEIYLSRCGLSSRFSKICVYPSHLGIIQSIFKCVKGLLSKTEWWSFLLPQILATSQFFLITLFLGKGIIGGEVENWSHYKFPGL